MSWPAERRESEARFFPDRRPAAQGACRTDGEAEHEQPGEDEVRDLHPAGIAEREQADRLPREVESITAHRLHARGEHEDGSGDRAGGHEGPRGGPSRRWAPWLFGVFGIGLVIGGAFTADPALGFPAGAAVALGFAWITAYAVSLLRRPSIA